MIIRAGSWVRCGLLGLVAGVGLANTPARAQYNPAPMGRMAAPLPQLPQKGIWGEVIMANNKWIVIQNNLGQQFPISLQGQGGARFLIRWPTSLNALTPRSLVEAIGVDRGSNTLIADEVVVYEGSAQSMVTPELRSLLGDGNRPVTATDPGYFRGVNAFEVGEQYSMYGWAFPVPPGNQGGARLRAVGRVANLNPLRLHVPANNIATVLPPASGNFPLTEVTLGSSTFVKKGDLAFVMPTDVTPKSLVVSHLVVWKKMPKSQFVP